MFFRLDYSPVYNSGLYILLLPLLLGLYQTAFLRGQFGYVLTGLVQVVGTGTNTSQPSVEQAL